MRDKGSLKISLAEVKIKKPCLTIPDIQPGLYFKLMVTDTGIGIDHDTLQNIFSPLFTTKSDKGGTGLGFSVVQYIVSKYGGQISVESAIGKGSTFNVYLPCLNNEKRQAPKSKVPR